MLLPEARRHPSPNCDDRPDGCDISLLVIHCISLPPGEFGGPWIDRFFSNELSPTYVFQATYSSEETAT